MPKEQIYNKLKPEEKDEFRKKFSKEIATKMPIGEQVKRAELKARALGAKVQEASFQEKKEKGEIKPKTNEAEEKLIQAIFPKYDERAEVMPGEEEKISKVKLLELTMSDGEKKSIGTGSRFTLRGTLGNNKEKALKGGYEIIGTRITPKDKVELIQAKKNPNDKNEKPFEFTRSQFEQYFKRDAVLFTASDRRQNQLNKINEGKNKNSSSVKAKSEQPLEEVKKIEPTQTENKEEKNSSGKITAETRLWSNDKVTRGSYKIKELPGKGNNEQYIFISESPSKKPITLRFTEKRLLKDLQEGNIQEIVTNKKTQGEPKNLTEIKPAENKIEDLKNKIAELMKEMPNANMAELDKFKKFFKGEEERPINADLAKVIQSGNKQELEEAIKTEYEKGEFIPKETEQTKN